MEHARRALSAVLIAGTILAVGISPASAGGHPVRFVSIQADPPGTDDETNASLNEEHSS
jgi:hypothetical protein